MEVFYQAHFLAGYENFSERWLMTIIPVDNHRQAESRHRIPVI